MPKDECIGLLGRIFGHKYIKHDIYSTHVWHRCWRCGKAAGS
jgi:hypothetical protein